MFSQCMKIKLLPSLREKKRYIHFNIVSEKSFLKNELVGAVESSCKNFLGELNYGKAGVNVVTNLVKGKSGVVRVNSKYVDHVKTSLMLIKKINGERVLFKNAKVSGVLNKLKGEGI